MPEVEKKKTLFTSLITEKRAEFAILLEKFNKMDDPIERYIKRQEMREVQEWLEEYGISVNIP
ncbi:MAG: hypothetical protein ACTSWL_09435 [Promethearchaeota archaeon]